MASSSGSTSSVTNVTFKDPETGKIVMVVANSTGSKQEFKKLLIMEHNLMPLYLLEMLQLIFGIQLMVKVIKILLMI
ncbi:MAG: hypothetical protein ACLUIS_03095 [Longibaculum sp.]